MNQFRLCYIDAMRRAWFTTKEVTEQWGDDWNDAPYEHNAGSPYGWSAYDEEKGREKWELTFVHFSSNLNTPEDLAGANSNFSVEMINNKLTPWLTNDDYSVKVWASTTLPEFVKVVEEAKGIVYLTKKQWEELES